jgi:hypothetical protein
MWRKALAMSLSLCYNGELGGLRTLWQDGLGVTNERYKCFHKAYTSPDGFNLWKSDGEYLMSQEFLSELMAEGEDPGSKSVSLLRYWLGEALISSGFDRVFESD